MTSVNLAAPRRALAIGAHPDDIEFGCGGTIAKWSAKGCAVTFLVCTDGARGSWDSKRNREELIETRHSEQRAAARELGASSDIIFLDLPDGELEAGSQERDEVATWIRRLRPEVLLGHDPWKRYRLHPDHRNAGFLVIEALVAAREPRVLLPADAAPHRPQTLLLFEPDQVDHLEDVTSTFAAKLAALTAHRSQLQSTMGVDPLELTRLDSSPSYGHFREKLHREHTHTGAPRALPLAEGFKRIDRL